MLFDRCDWVLYCYYLSLIIKLLLAECQYKMLGVFLMNCKNRFFQLFDNCQTIVERWLHCRWVMHRCCCSGWCPVVGVVFGFFSCTAKTGFLSFDVGTKQKRQSLDCLLIRCIAPPVFTDWTILRSCTPAELPTFVQRVKCRKGFWISNSFSNAEI